MSPRQGLSLCIASPLFFFPPLSTRPSLSIWLLLTSSFPSFLPLLCWQASHQKSDYCSCSSCDIWAFTVRYSTELISFYWKSWESYQAPRIIPVVVPLSKTPNPSEKGPGVLLCSWSWTLTSLRGQVKREFLLSSYQSKIPLPVCPHLALSYHTRRLRLMLLPLTETTRSRRVHTVEEHHLTKNPHPPALKKLRLALVSVWSFDITSSSPFVTPTNQPIKQASKRA